MSRRSHSFSLPIDVLEDIRSLAEERDESMSFIIREALREYLHKHLHKQGPRSQDEEKKRR